MKAHRTPEDAGETRASGVQRKPIHPNWAAGWGIVAFCLTLIPFALAIFLDPQKPFLLIVAAIVSGAVSGTVFSLLRLIGQQEARNAAQAEEAQKRHASLEAINARFTADLNTARQIQRNFLPDPRKRPFPEHLAFAHAFRPEMAVGGDYYDFKALDDHRLAILLADVSGHGMSAAFVTGLIKTAFEFHNPPTQSPSAFMGYLNNVLERLTPSHSFASVFYAIYDVEKRELLYSNAGHNPVPAILGPEGAVELDEPIDLLAGVNPDMKYQEGRKELAPGQKLLLCTDGIVDAVDERGERLGAKRLAELVRQNATLPAEALRNAIMQAVTIHTRAAERNDDQTLIVIEVLR